MSTSMVVQSEYERQVSVARFARERLMGPPPPKPLKAAPPLPRKARNNMKSLLERQLKSETVVPRGNIKFWLKALEEGDEEFRSFFEVEQQDWRKEVRDLILAAGENLVRLRSDNRDKPIVELRRQIALALRKRGWSMPRIGEFMHRDHTSILSLISPGRHRERYLAQRAAKAALVENSAIAKPED